MPPVKRFSLAGPSISLDPATDAFREDVADIALAGKVIAPHYAMAVVRKCRDATTLKPEIDSAIRLVELAIGDSFAVLDCAKKHAWGYTVADHRVGYVELAALD